MAQDLYSLWLRVSSSVRPPPPHSLLGLDEDCTDLEQIKEAAHFQLERLDRHALSTDPEKRLACQTLMNEVAAAAEFLRARASQVVQETDPLESLEQASFHSSPKSKARPGASQKAVWITAASAGAIALVFGLANLQLHKVASNSPSTPQTSSSPAPSPTQTETPPRTVTKLTPVAPIVPAIVPSETVENRPKSIFDIEGEPTGSAPERAKIEPRVPDSPAMTEPAAEAPPAVQPEAPPAALPGATAVDMTATLEQEIDLKMRSSWPRIFFVDGGKSLVAAGDNRFRFIDPSSLKTQGDDISFGTRPPQPNQQRRGWVDQSGRRLISLTDQGENVRVWDVSKRQQIGPTISFVAMYNADLSPDGQKLVACNGGNTSGANKSATIWDMVNGVRIGKNINHSQRIWQARFSPDGKLIVTASSDYNARTWDALTGDPVSPPVKHDTYAQEAVFSPDGKWVVSLSARGQLKMWHPRTGQVRWEFDTGVSGSSVAFSPSGKYIAAGGMHRTRDNQASWAAAIVVDSETGKPVTDLLRHDGSRGTAGPAIGFAFSHDEKWIVTHSGTGKTARVWDLQKDGTLLIEPIDHPRSVCDALFLDAASSADGKPRLITACTDGLLRKWVIGSGTSKPAVADTRKYRPTNTSRIVYLIDCSGSMYPALQQIKTEISRQVPLLTDSNLVNVMTFGSSQPKTLWHELFAVNGSSRTSIKDFVSTLQTDADAAADDRDSLTDTFNRAASLQPTDLWLFSDGDWIGLKQKIEVAREIALRANVHVNVMLTPDTHGFPGDIAQDMQASMTTLFDLAKQTGGVCVNRDGYLITEPPRIPTGKALPKNENRKAFVAQKDTVFLVHRNAILFQNSAEIRALILRQLASMDKEAKTNLILFGYGTLYSIDSRLVDNNFDTRARIRDMLGQPAGMRLSKNFVDAVKLAGNMRPSDVLVFSRGDYVGKDNATVLRSVRPVVQAGQFRLHTIFTDYGFRPAPVAEAEFRDAARLMWDLAAQNGGVSMKPNGDLIESAPGN